MNKKNTATFLSCATKHQGKSNRSSVGHLAPVFGFLLVMMLAWSPPSTTYAADASGQSLPAEPTSSLASVIYSVAKTFVDLMYELNPFLPSTVKDNAVLLLTQSHVDQTTEAINANAINYALTGFVGFSELGKPVQPGDGSNTQKYLDFLRKMNYSTDISSETMDFDTQEKMKDSYALYRDIMGILSTETQSKQYENFISKKVLEQTVGSKAFSMPQSKNLFADSAQDSIQMKIPQNLRMAFGQYIEAKKKCPPFPEDKDGGHPKCTLDKEKEAIYQQKFMYEIFYGDSKKRAQYEQGNQYYNINTLVNPLAYTPKERRAAAYLIKNIERSIELPPMQPEQIPIPLTDKQFNNVFKKLTDPDAKHNPIDKIIELQKKYTEVTRSLLINKSMLMNNFYHIYAKRLEDKHILASGVKDTQNQSIRSEKALSTYLANRRLDARWYRAMSEASPSTVARETLFVLAEMRQQMFEQQKQMEQLLLTLSVMALGEMKGQKTDLGLLNANIKRSIQDLLKEGSKQTEAISQAAESDDEDANEKAAASITDDADASVEPPATE